MCVLSESYPFMNYSTLTHLSLYILFYLLIAYMQDRKVTPRVHRLPSMSEPKTNPRRRPYNKSILSTLSTSCSSQDDPDDFRSLPLKKGETFHSPTTPSSGEGDPILHVPTLPRRSPTCPKSVEEAVSASQKRMADLIDCLERGFSGLGGDPSSNKTALFHDDSPLPKGILDARIANTDTMDAPADSAQKNQSIRSPSLSPRHHACDSTLGTSVCGSVASSSDGRGSY